jgi:hypothetical protein
MREVVGSKTLVGIPYWTSELFEISLDIFCNKLKTSSSFFD